MITITSEQALNILKILGTGAILTKSGSITLCYYLDNPICYSLTKDDLEERNKDFFRAFKHLGNNTYVQKQDVYLRKGFNSKIIKGDSFLQTAEREYFDGKTYIDHFCILAFSLTGLRSLESAYIKNPVKYDQNLTEFDRKRLVAFLEEVKSAVTILNNLPNTKLTPLTEIDVKMYLFNYVNGFYNDDGIRDNVFDNNLTIGDKKGAFFAICEAEYLPDILRTHIKDESLPTANATLYSGMLERLGVHLKASHVINQFWNFSSEYRGELSHKVRLFKQHQSFDKEIKRNAQLLDDLEREITEEGNIICKTHFNIYILEEGDYYEKALEYIKSIFKINDFKYYIPILDGLEEIYLGSIIGNAHKLNPLYWYPTDLRSSLCLMLHYTTYKNDNKGIFFNERLYNTPICVDVWDSPQGYKLPAHNGIVIASTGGGKSVTVLNHVQQWIEEGDETVIVEFGKSFYQLTQLYPDISLHVDYDGTKPLGINPFNLGGIPLTLDKINTLVNIVLKFWRAKDIKEDAKQVVSLRNILQDYYHNVNAGHSFPSFYNYVKDNFDNIADRLEISEDYFDIRSFTHVCKEFLEGGYYENVCKESELGELVQEKRNIVFELTKIKKDPFLISVIYTILLDVIETKLLDRSKVGHLVFDEYAEAQHLKDNFEDNSIHATVAFCYQKLRKENSGVWTIIQSPSQLSNDEFSKGIISNTQMLYVLPTTETVYDAVIAMFSIKNEAHINLMKSIKNNFSGQDKYSEFFVRFGDLGATVLRLQLSPEKFYAFQTDGDTWQLLQDEAQTIGLQQAITNKIYPNKK